MQVVEVHGATLDVEDAALAVLAASLRTTRRAVVVEESIQPGPVDQQITTRQHAQAIPIRIRHGGVLREIRGCEDGVVVGGDCGEGDQGVGDGLVVGRLRLDLTHVDILCVCELVLVFGVVLDGGAPEPEDAVGGLDVEAAAGEDGDLGATVLLVDGVVGGPEPFGRGISD